jgi:hypothetical protein
LLASSQSEEQRVMVQDRAAFCTGATQDALPGGTSQ